jgi:hypothetical protein
VTQYQVYFASTPGKAGTTNPSGNNLWVNSVIDISATAKSGYVFSKWTSSSSSITFTDPTLSSTTATINAPGTIVANFVTATYTVTFKESNLLSGTAWRITLNGVTQISSTDTITFNNIAAGTYSWSASNPVPEATGTQYVTSTPSGRITVTGSATMQIQYRTQYYLTMLAQPSSGGSISPRNGGWYDAGSTVSISANAGKAYVFSNWIGTGDGSYTGTSPKTSVTMSAPIIETATFTRQ